jgi:type IV secretory pathway VirB4 component
MMPTAHRVTTRHLQAAYLFQSEGGLGSRGVYIGRDVFGGSFVYDPFELYDAGVIKNPNMVIAGQLGYGKSALVKTYLARQLIFGRTAVVLSPKPGEYDPLAEAFGVTPIRIAPGGHARLNPLDATLFTGVPAETATQLRESLLVALAASALDRPLQPEEAVACDVALFGAGDPAHVALPAVVERLLEPTDTMAGQASTDLATLRHDGRKVGLALRRLVQGDLRGMFDGPTSPSVRMDRQLTVLDLSAVWGSDALGILMLCTSAWLQAIRARVGAGKRIEVVDEAWAVLEKRAVAQGMRQQFKLSRGYGLQNIMVIHGVTDLSAAGDQALIALGLLRDTETRVVLNTPADEVPAAARALGLTATQAAELPRMGEGRALWKVGRRTFLVDHRYSRAEAALINTNQAMTTRAAP